MPLFSYKCTECEQVVEKFQHNAKDEIEIACEECGAVEFERLPAWSNNRTLLNSRENLEKNILPDAERIRKDIRGGKDSAFFDIYGDS